MRKLFLLFLMLSASAQTLRATQYRVQSESEFKLAVKKCLPGDELIIASGTYANWAVEIAAKGTAAKPITITGDKNGEVIFSGETAQTVFRITGAYIHFRRITFSGCNLVKKGSQTGVLLLLDNASYCEITKCLFKNNLVKVQYSPLVIISGKSNYNLVSQCLFSDNVDNQDLQVKITAAYCPQFTRITNNIFKNKNKVSWKNGNGGECIQVGQDPILLGNSESNTVVSKNSFSNCNGENEIVSNKSSKNKYLNNRFTQNDGELVMRGGHDCIIEGNVFEGGTGGIRINGTGHVVSNNKINDVKTAIRLMYGMTKGKQATGFYVAASDCIVSRNKIANATVGVLVGDSKNEDWTGKFDTLRYPSPVMQNVAPFNNKIVGNRYRNTKTREISQ